MVIVEPLPTATGGVRPRCADLSVQEAVDVAVTVAVEAVGTTCIDEWLSEVGGLLDVLLMLEDDVINDMLEDVDAMLAVEEA